MSKTISRAERLSELMSREDAYFFSDLDDAVVRWDHKEQRFYARLSESKEFPIERTTDTVINALLYGDEISYGDYMTY